ncbi:hypothetical protein PL373_08015 [Tenacibaculum maritimum]|nr:hypothetical protein [Tenacibaculum maritimum]MDB0601091.1 hypothetical protein [Tenacibaculum maritimum]MDB0612172.1 hypothetical protein [Tenacibaculum maritimum]
MQEAIKNLSDLYELFPFIENISVKKGKLIEVTIKGTGRIFTINETVELLEWLENQ